MLKSSLLCSASIFITLINWTGVAKAEDDSIGLSFDLPPSKSIVTPTAEIKLKQAIARSITAESATREPRLAKPREILPPIRSSSSEDVALADRNIDVGVHFLENTVQVPLEPVTQQGTSVVIKNSLQALSFGNALLEKENKNRGNNKETYTNLANLSPIGIEYNSLGLDDWIFEGGARSLVAHTVGSAEGTRRSDGEKTQAYYGHKDPGNGVWNLGTFSYQHKADTPEEADEKQIRRLKFQGFQLEDQAAKQGMKLSLVEKLNGLDLANQAPLAALGQGGYIERLAQAHRLEMRGEEAIAWARTRAYIDPDTKAWNAPGLGNNLYSITKDQERRMSAINQALRAYERTSSESLALAALKNISLEGSGLEGQNFDLVSAESSQAGGFELGDLASAGLVEKDAIAPQIIQGFEHSPVSFALPAAAESEPQRQTLSAQNKVTETKPMEIEAADRTLTDLTDLLPENLSETTEENDSAAKLSWLRIENRAIDRP